MSDINKLIITGNLTKDAEQRNTGSGTAVLSFDVANNTGFGDKQKTSYFKCAIFGKRAEGALAQYLTKGAKVAIVGEVTQNCREHNGTKYCDLQVFVNDLSLIGGRNRDSDNGNQGQQPAPQNVYDAVGGDYSDEIPF